MTSLYWWRNWRTGQDNFGDALSPLVVATFVKDIRWTCPERAKLFALGSILEHRNYKAYPRSGIRRHVGRFFFKCALPFYVWGSGFLYEPKPTFDPRPWRRIRPLALRGRETLRVLQGWFGTTRIDPKTPLGDPGLLFGRLLPERPAPRYEIGLMLHFTDQTIGAPLTERLRQCYGERLCVLDATDPDALGTLTRLAQCRTILSSAMHGCIAADGLGIPNRLLHLSLIGGANEADWAFKFRDYYSALSEIPHPLTEADLPEDLARLPDFIERTYTVSQDAVAQCQAALTDAAAFLPR